MDKVAPLKPFPVPAAATLEEPEHELRRSAVGFLPALAQAKIVKLPLSLDPLVGSQNG